MNSGQGSIRSRASPRAGRSGPCARKGAPARRVAAVLALLLLAALMIRPASAAEPEDPLEPLNRAVFAFNQTVDGLLLEPAAELYGLILPEFVQRRVRGVLTNLAEPGVFVNDLLQGQRKRAGVALARFMINSTLGVAGLFDVAALLGHEAHDEDFGQTLGVWGVSAGPYLVVPLLGPSTPRDLLGRAVDATVFDPFGLVAPRSWRVARTATAVVVRRHELDPLLDELEASSLDFYAAMRSSYLQRRQSAIAGGRPVIERGLYELPAEDGPPGTEPEPR